MKRFHSSLLLLSTLFISACGFHLRGTVEDAFALPALHLQSADPHSEFSRLISSRIIAQQNIVNRPALTLVLAHEDLQQTLAVMGANTQNRQYTLVLTVKYALLNSHQRICERNEIRVVRSSSINPNQLLGSNNEQAFVISQMHNDATNQLIMRLASPEIRERCLANQKTFR